MRLLNNNCVCAALVIFVAGFFIRETAVHGKTGEERVKTEPRVENVSGDTSSRRPPLFPPSSALPIPPAAFASDRLFQRQSEEELLKERQDAAGGGDTN